MITTTEIRKIIVPIILDKVLITKRKDIILLNMYLFIKNNDFLNRIEFKREKSNITYLIRYYYTTWVNDKLTFSLALLPSIEALVSALLSITPVSSSIHLK